MLKRLKFSKVLEFIAFALMSALIIIMVVQVFARQFLSVIPVWSGEETANFLLTWIVGIGAGLAAAKNSHLAMDYFIDILKPKRQRVVEVLVYLIVSIFLALIMVISFQLAWSGRSATTARLDISMFWLQSSISVGSLIMLCYYIKHFIVSLKTLKKSRNNNSDAEGTG